MRNILITVMGLSLLLGCVKEPTRNEDVEFIIETKTIYEGNVTTDMRVTIKAEGGGKSFVADYSIEAGTAKSGTDLIESSGQVEFQDGVGVVDITIVADRHMELREEFYLSITSGETMRIFTFIIQDDDAPAEILSDADGFYTPDTYTSMDLVWSDEFDGTILNEEYWTYEMGDGCPDLCGWGNNELEIYTDDEKNIRLVDGQLIIEATKTGDVFNSARIITRDKVEERFGRIDIRARLPKGQGIWPALWMLGADIDQAGWPKCGEIDIMELVGHEPKIVHGTIHYDPGSGYKYVPNGYTLAYEDFSEQFHEFSLMWDLNKMVWYVDNEPFKTFVQTPGEQYPFNNEFFFIFNLAVGGNWPGVPDASTVFPQQMVVDYIRVFR